MPMQKLTEKNLYHIADEVDEDLIISECGQSFHVIKTLAGQGCCNSHYHHHVFVKAYVRTHVPHKMNKVNER